MISKIKVDHFFNQLNMALRISKRFFWTQKPVEIDHFIGIIPSKQFISKPRYSNVFKKKQPSFKKLKHRVKTRLILHNPSTNKFINFQE